MSYIVNILIVFMGRNRIISHSIPPVIGALCYHYQVTSMSSKGSITASSALLPSLGRGNLLGCSPLCLGSRRTKGRQEAEGMRERGRERENER